MRGYDVLAAHQINDIPILPMEPCIVTEGLLNHVRFRQTMIDRLGDYPFDNEQSIPEVIRDDEFLRDHAAFMFENNNVNHLYVAQDNCNEAKVRQFHEQIVRTAYRFRLNIDKLIEQRDVLNRMGNMLGGEKYIKKILSREFCEANAKAILNNMQREIKFVFDNKLFYERKIENFHFAIEALRTQLLKMMDEMFARRMGWGYNMQNPGHKFMVFIRHTPLVQSYVLPEQLPETNENSTSADLRLKKRALNQKLNCIIKVSSVDKLSDLMSKKSSIDFQILHFTENEEKLKLKIENLRDVFFLWHKTAQGYFTSYYYSRLFSETLSMFEIFLSDTLLNPRFATIETKYQIIYDLKMLISKEMDSSLSWYWYPTDSARAIKIYINKIYGNKYPQKPKENSHPFHAEL
jgi:hypothetical protein